MMIYIFVLCALAVITYLIQFQAYCHYRDIDLGSDLCEIIGLPIENAFEYEPVAEQL
jgi:hypothetical protein